MVIFWKLEERRNKF